MTMDEREAFHDWASDQGLQLRREDVVKDRDYFYEITETAWRAWLARAEMGKGAAP
jgi:tRNA A22 N-methylase